MTDEMFRSEPDEDGVLLEVTYCGSYNDFNFMVFDLDTGYSFKDMLMSSGEARRLALWLLEITDDRQLKLAIECYERVADRYRESLKRLADLDETP